MTFFQDCGYQIERNVISDEMAHLLYNYAIVDNEIFGRRSDDPLAHTLARKFHKIVEDVVGMKLGIGPCHYKIYHGQEALGLHYDKEDCCTITASINVGGTEGESEPLLIEGIPFNLGVRDMIIFYGSKLLHGRARSHMSPTWKYVQIVMHFYTKGQG